MFKLFRKHQNKKENTQITADKNQALIDDINRRNKIKPISQEKTEPMTYINFNASEIYSLIISTVKNLYDTTALKNINNVKNVAFSFSCFEIIYVICVNPDNTMLENITEQIILKFKYKGFLEYRKTFEEQIIEQLIDELEMNIDFNNIVNFYNIVKKLSEISSEYYSLKSVNISPYFLLDKYIKFSQKLINT